MRLPEIADRLREKAEQTGDGELTQLADAMSRRRPVKRATPRSARMTDTLRDQIRAYVRANPSKSQLEVSRVFNVNPGRISEATRGFRT